MKNFALIALLLAGGCASIPLNDFSVSQNDVDALREGYTIYLTAAVRYSKLPLCAPTLHFTLQAPCHEASVVAQMKAKDLVVNDSFKRIQAMIDSKTNTGLLGVYNALQTAITEAKALAPAGV